MSETLCWYKGTPEYAAWVREIQAGRGCKSVVDLLDLLLAEEARRRMLPAPPARTLPKGGAKPGAGRPKTQKD